MMSGSGTEQTLLIIGVVLVVFVLFDLLFAGGGMMGGMAGMMGTPWGWGLVLVLVGVVLGVVLVGH